MQAQEATPTPPAPPAPAPQADPGSPAAPGAGGANATTVTPAQLSSSPAAVYQAMREKREVLGDQMTRLLNRRNEVSSRLANMEDSPATRSALEQHIQEINVRIIDLEKQLHASDLEVAAAAGVPGATEPIFDSNSNADSEDAAFVFAIFASIAMVLVAVAWARRLWKGAGKVAASIPQALEQRFTRFEQSIDAMAIEIERVSEGQRFLTRVLSDQGGRAVGAGPAQPVEQSVREAERVSRG